MPNKFPKKAWVLTVDMGYGHQRASFPLRHIAEGEIITANNYKGIPEADKAIWSNSRKFYEFISRFKMVPLIGPKAFDVYDKLQSIPDFYPRRDLSKANIQLKEIYNFFKNKNWGKHLIDKISQKPLPVVTTFFVTAMMAEYFNYPGDIYCIVCDTDISRTWVALEPAKSRIIYLAPNVRVMERLKLYGVKPANIFLTGFPLDDENVGRNLKNVKADLGKRLINLDPKKNFISQYKETVIDHIGKNNLKLSPTRPLSITFAVGGAGAQREQAITIAKSLKKELLTGQMSLNLVAGTNKDVLKYFKENLKEIGLSKAVGKNVILLYEADKNDYFKKFNTLLRNTDILWTKPSELSFYCALGLPIIIAPPIGSQEKFNQQWLGAIAAGMKQEKPQYTNEWLKDWLDSGWLAEAAMQGFLEAPRYGTYNIEKIIAHKPAQAKKVQTVLQY